MTRLLPAMIVVVFMVLTLGTKGDAPHLRRRDGVVVIDWDEFFEWLCSNTVHTAWSPICGGYTTTTTTTRRTSTSTAPSTSATESSEEDSPHTSASTAPSTSSTESSEEDSPRTSASIAPSTSATESSEEELARTSASMGSSTRGTTSVEEESTSTSTVPPVSSTSTDDSSTSMSPSALERAHWCRFSNGTHVPLGYTFMHTECALCQCIPSHDIWCTSLQCMPTYCIDGSTPTPRPGQCCAQCEYENASTACVINGVSFPHGSVLRRTSDNIQCWCQLGSVECRKGKTALFSGLDWWGRGSAVYVIIIIICAVLFFGTLFCCGGSLFLYYYYQRQQQRSTQQAYEEYYKSAGWEAMPGEEGVVEGSAEEKQAEAEQDQVEYERPTGYSDQYIPPPYALYNGSYVNQPSGKDEK